MATEGNAKTVADFTAVPAPDYSSAKMAAMWQKQQQGHFTDVTIKVKDTSIPCHSVVLAVASPYFEAALSSENNKTFTIEDVEVDLEVMNNVIKFMYGQETTFKAESISSLLDISHMLQIEELKNQLAKYMSENLVSDNCLLYWTIGNKNNMDDMKKMSLKFMSSEITAVGASQGFKELSIAELLLILRDVSMECRDELLIACVEWVDYQPAARKQHMLDILKNVQLEMCSLKIMKFVKHKYQYLLYEVSVLNIIQDEVFKREAVESDKTNEKNKSLVLLGVNHNDNKFKCYVTRNTDNFQWDEFAEVPSNVHRYFNPVVCIANGLIVLGRDKRNGARYDATQKAWTNLPQSPTKFHSVTGLLCNNDVYVLGGLGPLSSVHRLSLGALTWQQEPDMLVKQYWPIATASGGSIFVVYNDHNGDKTPISLQVFNTQTTRSWQYKSSLPQDASSSVGSNLVADEDSLYLVGGDFNVAARYHIATDVWTLLTTPTIYHSYGAAVLHSGRIYVIGGGGYPRDTSVYDIANNKWSTLPANLPQCFTTWSTAAAVTWL